LKTNYVFIDLENVQPKNIPIIKNHPFKVIVFVGENQTKIPFEIAEALQKLGDNATYIKIHGNGSNALDFHIAYYIGKLTEQDNDAYFHIISKDTGFDPLIKHLKERKIFAQRKSDLTNIPILGTNTQQEKLNAIIKNLLARGQGNKPKKVKTLKNAINSIFMKTLEDQELLELLDLMVQKEYIAIDNKNVSYKLPGVLEQENLQ